MSIYGQTSTLKRQLCRLEESELSDHNIKLLKDFVRQMQAENLSENRIIRYIESFLALEEGITFELDQASREEIRDLIIQINEREIGNAGSVWTDAEYRKAVRKFYNYHEQDEEWIRIQPPEKDKPYTDFEELPKPRHILALIDGATNTRDKALIFFLHATGGRISEVLNVKWSDVHLKHDRTRVIIRNGKTGSRSMTFYLDDRLLRQWRSKQEEYRKQDTWKPPKDDVGKVFTRHNGRQLSYKSARKAIDRARRHTDLPEHVKTNPQAFRKTRASQKAYIDSFKDLMDDMGWSKPKTAMNYCRTEGREHKKELFTPKNPLVVPPEPDDKTPDVPAAQTTLQMA